MRALLLLVLLLAGACSQKVWVLEDPAQVSNGLRISVKTEEWKHTPYSLSFYFLPVYLELENLTAQPVSIGRGDVYLLDSQGNQYNPIEPSQVHSILRREYRTVFSIGLGYYSYPFSLWWSPYYALPSSPEVYPEVINYALSFGELQPGARLRGFVYFPQLSEKASPATLYVKGYRFALKLKKE